LAGNLMGKAFESAFDLAGKAGKAFIDQLGKAEESYQSAIKSAQVYNNTFGGSLQEGQNAIYKMQAELAKQAAVLPGSAEDYAGIANAIFDNLSATSSNAKEAMDKISQFSIKIGSRFSRETGITESQQIRLAERLFTDNLSIKSMGRLMPVMQDVALKKSMAKAEVAYGRSFGEASGRVRELMLESVFNELQTDGVLNAASSTAGSAIAQIKDRMFGLYSGLFGARRDLDDAEGEQSIYTKLGGLFHSTIKLGDKWGTIAQRLGLNFDPLKSIADGIDGLTKWVDGAAKFLERFEKGNLPSSADFDRMIGSGAKDLAGFTNNVLKIGFEYFKTIDAGDLGAKVGTALGDFFGNLDYLTMFASTQQNMQKAGQFFGALVLKTLERLAVNAAKNILDSGNQTFQGITDRFKDMFKAISDFFGNIFSKIGGILGGFSPGLPPTSAAPSGAFSSIGGGLFDKPTSTLTPIVAPTLLPVPAPPPEPKVGLPFGGKLFGMNNTFNISSDKPTQEIARDVVNEVGRLYRQQSLATIG
jgi:hypothetical protein